jgi:hypothetical protein
VAELNFNVLVESGRNLELGCGQVKAAPSPPKEVNVYGVNS